jgi:hypothetical protein
MQTPLLRADDAAVAHRWGVNSGVSKALTDKPSESFEGHNVVRMTGIEETSVMANVQDVSFLHEGADDSHWADGRVLQDLRQVGGPRHPAQSVSERDAGTG